MTSRLLFRLRDRMEGCLFAVVLMALLPLLFAKWISDMGSDSATRRSWWRFTRRRWWLFLRRGLRPVREQWWDELRHESQRVAWRYVMMLEVANLLPRRHLSAVAGLVHDGQTLFIKLTHIGDVLHLLPSVQAFRSSFPENGVDLLAGPWSSWVERRMDLFQSCIYLSPALIQFNRKQSAWLAGLLSELHGLIRLRRRGYALVVSSGGLSLPELAYVYWVDPQRWVLSGSCPSLYPFRGDVDEVELDRTRYEAEQYMSLMHAVGVEGRFKHLWFPLEPEERELARVLLEGNAVPSDARLICLAPGSGWPGKNWPAERYAELAGRLMQQQEIWIAVLGTLEDRPAASLIREKAGGRVIDFTGGTSLGTAAALVECAALYIGNDSGLLHIAAALDVPSVGLFGPTRRAQWAPQGELHCSIQERQDCTGCIYWHPCSECQHANRCMKSISSDSVELAALSLLDGSNLHEGCR